MQQVFGATVMCCESLNAQPKFVMCVYAGHVDGHCVHDTGAVVETVSRRQQGTLQNRQQDELHDGTPPASGQLVYGGVTCREQQ